MCFAARLVFPEVVLLEGRSRLKLSIFPPDREPTNWTVRTSTWPAKNSFASFMQKSQNGLLVAHPAPQAETIPPVVGEGEENHVLHCDQAS